MSQGGSFNKEDSYTAGAFDQNISGPQDQAMQDMWGGANNWINQNQQGISDFLGGANQQLGSAAGQSYANMMQNNAGAQDAFQNQLGGGAYADAGANAYGGKNTNYNGMGLQDSLMGSLNQSLNNPSAMQDINSMIMGGSGNNYADAMKQQYMSDANRAQEQMMGNLDARAAASGMSGGSAYGNAIGRGMEDINSNLQRNMAETGYNTFNKDLDRKLNIAQQADQGTLARQGMMSGMLGDQQQAQNNLMYGDQAARDNMLNQQNAAQQGGLAGLGAMNQQASAGTDLANATQQQQLANMNQGQNDYNWMANLIGDPTVLSKGQGMGSSSGKGSSGSAGVK